MPKKSHSQAIEYCNNAIIILLEYSGTWSIIRFTRYSTLQIYFYMFLKFEHRWTWTVVIIVMSSSPRSSCSRFCFDTTENCRLQTCDTMNQLSRASIHDWTNRMNLTKVAAVRIVLPRGGGERKGNNYFLEVLGNSPSAHHVKNKQLYLFLLEYYEYALWYIYGLSIVIKREL